MNETLLETLKEQHDKTGGHCGLYITDFKGNLQELKKEINELYKAKKITIHDGIHGKLIKYNNEQQT